MVIILGDGGGTGAVPPIYNPPPSVPTNESSIVNSLTGGVLYEGVFNQGYAQSANWLQYLLQITTFFDLEALNPVI
jgi:hypothetical protein